jgi:hypothetical protein
MVVAYLSTLPQILLAKLSRNALRLDQPLRGWDSNRVPTWTSSTALMLHQRSRKFHWNRGQVKNEAEHVFVALISVRCERIRCCFEHTPLLHVIPIDLIQSRRDKPHSESRQPPLCVSDAVRKLPAKYISQELTRLRHKFSVETSWWHYQTWRVRL